MLELLSRVVWVLKRRGPAGTIRRLAEYGFERAVFHKIVLLVFESRVIANLHEVASPAGFEFRTPTLAEIAREGPRSPWEFTRKRIAQAAERLERNEIPLAVFEGDRLVHLSWLALREELAPEELGGVTLPASGFPIGVIYDCWTSEACRGRGLYPIALKTLLQIASAHCSSVHIYCEAWNAASRRGIEKAGFRLRWTAVRTRWIGRWGTVVITDAREN